MSGSLPGEEGRGREALVIRANLKFKSFEKMRPTIASRGGVPRSQGKQIFTVSLIHAEKRLIDVVDTRARARALFFCHHGSNTTA